MTFKLLCRLTGAVVRTIWAKTEREAIDLAYDLTGRKFYATPA